MINQSINRHVWCVCIDGASVWGREDWEAECRAFGRRSWASQCHGDGGLVLAVHAMYILFYFDMILCLCR